MEERQAADAAPPGEVLTRLSAVVDWANALLVGVDPRLVYPPMLQGADIPAQQLQTALNAYIDNGDQAQLGSIDNACGDLTVALAQWPTAGVYSQPAVKRLARVFGSAAEARIAVLRRDAEAAAAELQSRFDSLGTQLQALQGGIDEAHGASSERQEQLSAEFTTLQGQVDGLVTSTEASLAQIREVEENRFVELANEVAERANAAASEQRGRFDALEQAVEKRAENLLTSLEAQRDQARDLLDVVATSATAGAFGREADAQKGEADQWRVHATRAAVAAAGIGLAAVLSGFFFHSSATLLVTKVAFTAVVAGIAGYAAGQSAQHRKREVRARRLFLELTAFGPFVEPLTDEDRATVRKDFIARLFVGDPQDQDGEVALTKESISLVGQFASALQRVS